MADIVLIDNLQKINVDMVLLRGRLVAKNGRLKVKLPKFEYPPDMKTTVRFGGIPTDLNYMIPAENGKYKVRVITAHEGSLLTGSETHTLEASDGYIQADPKRDILTIAVTERYMKGGNIGVGFINLLYTANYITAPIV